MVIIILTLFFFLVASPVRTWDWPWGWPWGWFIALQVVKIGDYLSTVHTAPFLCKSPYKSICFCGFTLLTATEEKISVSVVLITWQWANARFCTFTLIYCVFQISVYLNIPLEGRICKPHFLCGLVSTVSQKRRYKPAFTYENVAAWAGLESAILERRIIAPSWLLLFWNFSSPPLLL